MKPTVKIASTTTQQGGEIILYSHDRDYFITLDGRDLMNSRQHESELGLARLGCAHLAGRQKPGSVLIGGLGMGYTLRAALDAVNARSEVTVSELAEDVIGWNRDFLGELNGHPLNDKRVKVEQGDVLKLIFRSQNRFDAILLDVDNGPSALSGSTNNRLYNNNGIQACRQALRNRGCLAVWSSEPDKKFERRLMYCGFHVRRYRVPAYKGSKSQSHFVWVASEKKENLPPGGGAPRSAAGQRKTKGDTRRRRT